MSPPQRNNAWGDGCDYYSGVIVTHCVPVVKLLTDLIKQADLVYISCVFEEKSDCYRYYSPLMESHKLCSSGSPNT